MFSRPGVGSCVCVCVCVLVLGGGRSWPRRVVSPRASSRAGALSRHLGHRRARSPVKSQARNVCSICATRLCCCFRRVLSRGGARAGSADELSEGSVDGAATSARAPPPPHPPLSPLKVRAQRVVVKHRHRVISLTGGGGPALWSRHLARRFVSSSGSAVVVLRHRCLLCEGYVCDEQTGVRGTPWACGELAASARADRA